MVVQIWSAVRLLTSHIALSVCAMDDDVASKFMGGNSFWDLTMIHSLSCLSGSQVIAIHS